MINKLNMYDKDCGGGCDDTPKDPSKWYSGHGVPNILAKANDHYLDTLSGNVYMYTGGDCVECGRWELKGNIRGPVGEDGAQGIVGPTGPQGIPGPAGPKGEKGDSGTDGTGGTGGTDGGNGNDGGSGELIIGPPGPQGPQGVAGPLGPVGPAGPPGPQGPSGNTGSQGPAGSIGPQGPPGPPGSGGGSDIDWESVQTEIDNRVDSKIQEILDMIEDGEVSEIERNQLKAIMNGIIKDHARILHIIDLYDLDDLGADYVTAYNALLLYVEPYVNGTSSTVANPTEFASKFEDFYEAKAAVESAAITIARNNELQAALTKERFDQITDFWSIQFYENEGVIVAGTMLVGTRTQNNAGITGVTDQGSSSVRIWAGGTYAQKNTAKFRVLDNGNFWSGTSSSGMDFGITSPGVLTIRGVLSQDGGGNVGVTPINRGDYEGSATYWFGNLVKYGGSLWMYKNVTSGNGGVPNESNTNWELWITSGTGIFRSTVYRRATTQPATPTGGDFSSPRPTTVGWTDGPTAAASPDEKLWVTTRIFTQDGSLPQESAWKTPTEAVDTETMEIRWCLIETNTPSYLGTPDTNPENWSTEAEDAVFWAVRYKVAGSWTAWQITRIKGENGTNGNDGAQGSPGKFTEFRFAVGSSPTSAPSINVSTRNPAGWTKTIPSGYDPTGLQYLWKTYAEVDGGTDMLITTWVTPYHEKGKDGLNGVDGSSRFKAFAFKRSASPIISVPTGGSYAVPIPDGGWTDSVPAGNDPLYMTTRFWSTKANETDLNWSIPQLAVDTEQTDFEWSDSTSANPGVPEAALNGALWKNNPAELTNPVNYMAVRYRASAKADWGDWVVSKVRGEKGEDGVAQMPPLIFDRGQYAASATYVGSSSRVDLVMYEGNAYLAKIDAGSFTGNTPSYPGNAKWERVGAQFTSVYATAVAAATASFQSLMTERLIVKTGSDIRTTVNYTKPGDGTTNTSVYDLAGTRHYYPSGRISAYMGIVNNLTFNGKTLNNKFAIVTFQDIEGSPILWVLESASTTGGVQYITVSSASWDAVHLHRLSSTFQSISKDIVDPNDFEMRIETQEPATNFKSIFNGKIDYGPMTGYLAINKTHTYEYRTPANSESDLRGRYVTTRNNNDPIPDGWYIVTHSGSPDYLNINSVSVDPNSGATGWPAYMLLDVSFTITYIENGYPYNTASIQQTYNIATTSPTAGGSSIVLTDSSTGYGLVASFEA